MMIQRDVNYEAELMCVAVAEDRSAYLPPRRPRRKDCT